MGKLAIGVLGIGVLFLTLTVFENCGSPNDISPSDTSTINSSVQNTLTISPSGAALQPNQQVQFSASGGTPPYTFSTTDRPLSDNRFLISLSGRVGTLV